MIDWSELRDAYGSAEAVPSLLTSAEAGDPEAWNELWSRLCHQGTVYSASSPALPALARMAERQPSAGYSQPLFLAATIASSTDRGGASEPRVSYATEISTLRNLAERNLAFADGTTDFAYALQALLAFEDVPVWQNHLDSIANEYVEMDCLGCSEHLEIGLGFPDFATRLFTGDPTPGGASTPVTPADPSSLIDGEARVYELANAHAQNEFVERVLYLFGDTACPGCEQTFSIPQALADA